MLSKRPTQASNSPNQVVVAYHMKACQAPGILAEGGKSKMIPGRFLP